MIDEIAEITLEELTQKDKEIGELKKELETCKKLKTELIFLLARIDKRKK